MEATKLKSEGPFRTSDRPDQIRPDATTRSYLIRSDQIRPDQTRPDAHFMLNVFREQIDPESSTTVDISEGRSIRQDKIMSYQTRYSFNDLDVFI